MCQRTPLAVSHANVAFRWLCPTTERQAWTPTIPFQGNLANIPFPIIRISDFWLQAPTSELWLQECYITISAADNDKDSPVFVSLGWVDWFALGSVQPLHCPHPAHTHPKVVSRSEGPRTGSTVEASLCSACLSSCSRQQEQIQSCRLVSSLWSRPAC